VNFLSPGARLRYPLLVFEGNHSFRLFFSAQRIFLRFCFNFVPPLRQRTLPAHCTPVSLTPVSHTPMLPAPPLAALRSMTVERMRRKRDMLHPSPGRTKDPKI